MTNFKLKLMFFLLNSLLSADIVYSRPYSNANTTDVFIFNENSNNTFSLPIDPNSDTLRVTNDYEIKNEKEGKETKAAKEAREEKEAHEARETDKSSKTSLEAIVNAEQDRDEALSKKVMKDQNKVEYQNPEADVTEKQSNISSSLLEDIINSETDREDTITDILFRPEAEFAEDVPKFEFLIAGKINESEVNRTVNELERDKNSSDVLKKVDYVELVEVIKPGKENNSAYMLNITVHEVDDDLAPDTILSVFSGFTDVQTLFLACFGTLIPLLAVLFATLFIRCLCRRYCPLYCRKSTSSSPSVSSDKQDANQQKHKKASRIPNIFAAALHLDQRKRHWFTPFENRTRKDKLKSPTEESTGTGDAENGEAVPANGSIFTMTLKNNHLIVETEERNDITKNGRETKMKYSPDNDGIFVVEVQQSQAYRPKNLQNSPPQDPQISTNQALIHRVPEELEKIEEDSDRSTSKVEKDKALALSSTGLSISDLSMSSIGSHNISYSYSSQMGYEQGPFGYPIYTGYEIKEDINEGIVNDNSQEPLISKTPDYDKPVVTAAIFKQDSIIGNDLQGPGYCIEGSTDGPLLSDVQAREYSLQHLHDQKNIENGIAVPIEKVDGTKSFNRADSLPVRLEEDCEILPMETIIETPKDGFVKRGSLPTIKTDMYETVKDVIIGSPKFEKFVNDSPGEYDCPPMITITEESESSKSEATS